MFADPGPGSPAGPVWVACSAASPRPRGAAPPPLQPVDARAAWNPTPHPPGTDLHGIVFAESDKKNICFLKGAKAKLTGGVGHGRGRGWGRPADPGVCSNDSITSDRPVCSRALAPVEIYFPEGWIGLLDSSSSRRNSSVDTTATLLFLFFFLFFPSFFPPPKSFWSLAAGISPSFSHQSISEVWLACGAIAPAAIFGFQNLGSSSSRGAESKRVPDLLLTVIKRQSREDPPLNLQL